MRSVGGHTCLSRRLMPRVLCIVITVIACNGHAKPKSIGSDHPVLDSLVTRYPCKHDAIVSNEVAPLTEEQRCALVEAGFRAIASGRGAPSGVMVSDTARIRGATIWRFAFRDTNERPSITYWSIDYDVGDPARTPTVRIDALTGQIDVGRASNP